MNSSSNRPTALFGEISSCKGHYFVIFSMEICDELLSRTLSHMNDVGDFCYLHPLLLAVSHRPV